MPILSGSYSPLHHRRSNASPDSIEVCRAIGRHYTRGRAWRSAGWAICAWQPGSMPMIGTSASICGRSVLILCCHYLVWLPGTRAAVMASHPSTTSASLLPLIVRVSPPFAGKIGPIR